MPYLVRTNNSRAAKDALEVRFTDLQSGDVATVRSVFAGLSELSRYQRFHTARSQLPRPMQRRLADVRRGSHEAHVAVLGNRPLGIARWIRCTDDPGKAELAIEVIDAAQFGGIGRQLAAQAARSARAAGVELFLAIIDQAHQDLRISVVEYGARVDEDDPDVLLLPVNALLRALERPAPADRFAQQRPPAI